MSAAGGQLPLFVTAYPAVMLVALLGGVGPGLVATATTVVCVDYFVLEPRGSFAVASTADAVSLALFACIGVFISAVAERYRRHRDTLMEMVAARTAALDQSNAELKQKLEENRKSREALRESRERLDLALVSSRMATFEWDIVNDQRQWSEGVHNLLGTKSELFTGTAEEFFRVMPAEDRTAVQAALTRAINVTGAYETDYRAIWPDGSIHDISARGKVHYDADGRAVRLSGVCWDVTQFKKKEHELHKLNRTLRALKESSQAMTRANSEAEYLDDVCRSVIAKCGYAMVWVGFAEDDERRTVRPVAHCGFEEGYLETLQVSWADNEFGRGPTGTAIRTGKPSVCQNMLTDPAFAPWRAQALKRGYCSSVALPLLAEDRAFGAIMIYSRQPDPFSDEEVQVLVELAEAVANGVRSLRAIEQRRRAEEQLRLLSTAVESAANGIAITDRDARILWVNPAFSRLTGYNRDEVVGQNPRILKSDRHAPAFYREMWNTLLKGEPWHGELVNRQKNGSLHVEEMTITPVHSDGEEITHFVAIKQDVTARKRAERRTELLAETASRLLASDDPRGIVDELCRNALDFLDCQVCLSFLADENQQRLHLGACVGFARKDAEKFGSVNPCVTMCGSTAHEGCRLVAQRIQETADPKTEFVRAHNLHAYACHPLMVSGVLLGTISFGTCTREDFSEDELLFMRTLCDLVAISLERARLTRAVGRSRDLLERANVAKDNFLAALSHELRTPLSPVLILAEEAAADPAMPATARETFSTIAKNVRLEARLIDDLLDLSRIIKGKLSLDRQLMDVHETVRDAIDTVQREVNEKRIVLAVKLAPGESRIWGDAVRLRQIFWNVLRNALKFTAAGGTITVESVRLPGCILRIKVADTGIGMTSEEIARAFDSFSQGDHARSGGSHRFGGLGLGLSISRTLVEMHSGSIWAESAGPNHGSTFFIDLPVLSVEDKRESLSGDRPKAPGHCPPAAENPSASRRILLVEDHEPTRKALARVLRHRHTLVSVGSLAEARVEASNANFDLLISDLGLPDGTGYDLAAELRSRHGLKAIALSGYGREDDVIRGREAGFSAHLIKPVSIEMLEAALAAIWADSGADNGSAPGSHG